MSDFNRGYTGPATAGSSDMAVDAGLRAFMLGVYNKVALGLIVSAGMAYLTGAYEPVKSLMYQTSLDGRFGYTPLGLLVVCAPLAIILFSNFFMRSISPRTSGFIYWSIVLLIGASMGTIVMFYTGTSIASTFLITAVAFGSLSLFGYTTKRDLTPMYSFLIIGLVGVIIAIFVSMFMHSEALMFIISIVGVLVFAGLIAYRTQSLKMTYYQLGGDQASLSVATNYGALNLYLAFINMFRFLLLLVGGGRR